MQHYACQCLCHGIRILANESGGTTALDLPFLLLPFRPTSDPSAVRTFVRHFFDHTQPVRGDSLAQELRMTEPMVRQLPPGKHGMERELTER